MGSTPTAGSRSEPRRPPRARSAGHRARPEDDQGVVRPPVPPAIRALAHAPGAGPPRRLLAPDIDAEARGPTVASEALNTKRAHPPAAAFPGHGEIPEGSKWSTVNLGGSAFGGSNPPLPTTPLPASSDPARSSRIRSLGSVPRPSRDRRGGRSSMAERQPSKLLTWVRFPSPAPGRVVSGIGPRPPRARQERTRDRTVAAVAQW